MNKDEHLSSIIKHVQKVESNCNTLAKKIAAYNLSLSLRLIQLGRIHDASKFDEFEFFNLHRESPNFHEALKIHHSKNPHHPEYWPTIHDMPDEYLAEMVCDCVARSQEFGTDVRAWFLTQATIKYDFDMDDATGVKITNYLNLLLTPLFKQ